MESTVLDAFCATTSLGCAISQICCYKRKSEKLQVLPQQEVSRRFTKTFLQVQIQLWTWQFFNPIYQHQCHSALNFPFLPKNLRQPTHSPISFSQQVQVLTNAATESIFTRFCWLQPFAVRLRTCTLGFASTSTLEGCWLTSAFRPDDEGKCVCTHSSVAAAGVKAKANIYASEAINHNHDSMEKHSTLHC